MTQAALRYSNVALASVGFLTLSGIGNAWTRMDTVSDLWNSGYGRLVLIKTLILAVLVGIAAVVRRRFGRRLGRIAAGRRRLVSLELGLLAIAGGLAVALAQTPYPRAENFATTVAEQLLGRSMPQRRPPPT